MTGEEMFAEECASSLARVRAVAAALDTRWDDPQVAADLDEVAAHRGVLPGEFPF